MNIEEKIIHMYEMLQETDSKLTELKEKTERLVNKTRDLEYKILGYNKIGD